MNHSKKIQNVMKHIISALCVSFLCLTQAQATEPQNLTAAYGRCLENSGGVTMTMMDCIGVEYGIQDKRLNEAYQKLMTTLTPERQKQLKETQRLWIQYTESNCTFYYDPDGGTLARVTAAQCGMYARAERANELAELLTSN